ncbi:hypothetical protein [Fodinicola feengrottensis]|uniref:hypothetical protein n=1 Tax=Fodinicola feengrottensis TaxID=435914 RepID=UPI0024417A22|nr:hypothetical protein [Fodinicola feengrottensis]
MTESTAVAFPFAAPGHLQPPAEFAALREGQPVRRVALPYGGEGWLVTRYADVKTVLADPRFSRAAAVGAGRAAQHTGAGPAGQPAVDGPARAFPAAPAGGQHFHHEEHRKLASAYRAGGG